MLDDEDGTAACAYDLDLQTGEPVTRQTLSLCGDMMEARMESLEPGTMDMLDVSMINGNGTVTVDLVGSEVPNPMVKTSDGERNLSVS